MELETDGKFVEMLQPSEKTLSEESLHQLASDLIKNLRQKQLQIGVAESCSGGWIAKLITDVAGCSDVFQGSLVTYSNVAKQKLLGVSPAGIDTYGAVSREVVCEMAAGVLRVLPADCSVAVSGVAGPGGGSEQKPVGTVWICWQLKDVSVAHRFVFDGDRESIRRATCYCALEGMRQWLVTG
jgi:nicotinamide-nucleotide amidase